MKKLLFLLLVISNSIIAQPVWLSVKTGMSSDIDEPIKMAIDQNDNVYMAGKFMGTDMVFDTTHAYSTSSYYSLYVVKFNSSGTVKWLDAGSTSFGDVQVRGIDVDGNGNVYVGGFFDGTGLIFGNDTLNSDHQNQGFIAKYDSTGQALWGKTYFSSPGNIWNDQIFNMNVDASGNIYIAGSFEGSTITIDTITIDPIGSNSRMFCAKLNTNGNVYWAKQAGNLSLNAGQLMVSDATTDDFGNFYITGKYNQVVYFDSIALPAGTSGTNDYIAKYNSNGILQWVRDWHCSGLSDINSITCDPSGNVFIGWNYSGPSITLGNQTFTNKGQNDLCIIKYTSSGVLDWVKAGGGNYNEEPLGMFITQNGDLLVVGYFESDSLSIDNLSIPNPITGGPPIGPFKDFFLMSINATGTIDWLIPADAMNGPAYATDVAVDNLGAMYVAGTYAYQVTFGQVTIPNTGGTWNSFLLKADLLTMIESAKMGTSVFIFPNPSTGIINIQSKDEILSIDVFDLSGRLINHFTAGKNQIQISDEGVFILSITTTEGVIKRSIVNIHY